MDGYVFLHSPRQRWKWFCLFDLFGLVLDCESPFFQFFEVGDSSSLVAPDKGKGRYEVLSAFINHWIWYVPFSSPLSVLTCFFSRYRVDYVTSVPAWKKLNKQQKAHIKSLRIWGTWIDDTIPKGEKCLIS